MEDAEYWIGRPNAPYTDDFDESVGLVGKPGDNAPDAVVCPLCYMCNSENSGYFPIEEVVYHNTVAVDDGNGEAIDDVEETVEFYCSNCESQFSQREAIY